MTTTRPTHDYPQKRWSLSDLLPDATQATVAARLDEAETAVAAFEARRPQLATDMLPATLLEIVRDFEGLIEQLYVIGAYGSLWFAEDTERSGPRLQEPLGARADRIPEPAVVLRPVVEGPR